ncbi:MAG: CHAT domain-containing protein [Vicinamibacteria bacterium]
MDHGRRLRQLTPGLSWSLAALCLSLFACASRPNEKAADADRDRARLVAAVGERRILHGRASGGFAFGPEISRKRGLGNRTDVPFEVLGIAAEVRKQFDLDPTPAATGNLALAYLLTGDAEKGTRLAELRVLQEETPEALNDLSAAHLERAINEGAPDEFPRAYDAALRALRKRPGQLEALFDRAMAVDGMGLAWMARQSWDEFLAAEPNGPWSEVAREARTRAAAREAENDRVAKERPRLFAAWAEGRLDTVRGIATRRPDLARELIRREALPAVARARLEGRSVRESLALARELNDMAEPVDKDSLDREALVSLEHGDRALAAAHIEFAKASQALDDREVDKGSPGVLHATTVFRQKGSPYVALGELQSGLVDFFQGRRARLVARYSALIVGNQGRYPLLRARSHWMRALCYGLVLADEWQALRDRRAAFSILTEAGQLDPARQMASQLWSSLSSLGLEREASQILEAIAASLSVEDAPLRVSAVVEALTTHLTEKSLLVAALEVRRGLGLHTRRGGATQRMNAALAAAELGMALGDRVAATQSLELAGRALRDIDDEEIHAEMEILYGLASLEVNYSSPSLPPASLNRIRVALHSRPNETSLAKALTLQGEKDRTNGRVEASAAALEEALDLHLARRSRTAGEFERIKQFEGAERVADDLVGLLSETGRSADALGLIERLRDPDGFVARGNPSGSDLPQATAVLSYWVLNDRVLVAVLNDRGTQYLSLHITRASLRNDVQRLKASMDVESNALVQDSLARLYTSLVSPLTQALAGTHRLVIVPDRELSDVPFAGLRPNRDAEPLAARYEISFASSVLAGTRAHEAWRTPKSVLAIGGPTWDKGLFGDMTPLPESLKEATAVAALYERGRMLGGAGATKEAIRRLAPGFEVIHIATHAIENERDPGESSILLSPRNADPGVWRARDSGWDSFSRARLVVLSACRTGTAHSRFAGTSLGILRSIQRATNAQVLVSIGDVDDAASRHLLEAFHRRLVAGDPPAAALRLAQLESLTVGAGMNWMLYRIIV